MKRLLVAVLMLLLLCGCSKGHDSTLAQLRRQLSGGSCAAFSAELTAFYSDYEVSFCLDCEAYSDGKVRFSVSSPETLKGIVGVVNSEGAELVFEDIVLGVPLLSQSRISPMLAPWIFFRALCDGAVEHAETLDGAPVTITDVLREEELRIDIYFSRQLPSACEVYSDGCRILSMEIRDFRIK